MVNKQHSQNEGLREALLDLERSRQKEVEEREVAEALLRCLEIISNFSKDRAIVFKNLFENNILDNC